MVALDDTPISRLFVPFGAALVNRLSRTVRFTKAVDAPPSPEAMTQALLMLSHDHGEFYAAWRDKRPPDWQGR